MIHQVGFTQQSLAVPPGVITHGWKILELKAGFGRKITEHAMFDETGGEQKSIYIHKGKQR